MSAYLFLQHKRELAKKRELTRCIQLAVVGVMGGEKGFAALKKQIEDWDREIE